MGEVKTKIGPYNRKTNNIECSATKMDNHYTDDEINELQNAVSLYVQGNGPETDTYTDKETAYEIRAALREHFENINTLGLTELVEKSYEVVKLKGNECPDEWFSDMLYLNEQIVRASGTKRSDAEIIAHVIKAAPKFYNISLSIIRQSEINASNALSKAQTELRNYWKRNLEGKIGRQQGKQSHGSN
jgi:mevalonate kinase